MRFGGNPYVVIQVFCLGMKQNGALNYYLPRYCQQLSHGNGEILDDIGGWNEELLNNVFIE